MSDPDREPPQLSPFRPGFNEPPQVLAGRDEVLLDATRRVASIKAGQPTPSPLVLVGARGVGKTVLLGEIAARTDPAKPWPRVHVEARDGADFAEMLLVRIERTADALRGKRSRRRRERFRVSGGEVEAGLPVARGRVRIDRQDAAIGPLEIEDRLADLARLASAADSGVVITFDELQEASRTSLKAVASAIQAGVPQAWPLLVVAAGLMSIRQPQRLTTYFERGDWRELGALDATATHLALEQPAADAGRPFERQAAELLATASGGYPFAVQIYGDCAWLASEGEGQITVAAAEQALHDGARRLHSSLYAQRWADAAPREREYLTAMAAAILENGSVTGAEVARRLGRTAKQVSYLRDRLLEKGTLVSDGRQLQFVVPGFATYANRENSGDIHARIHNSG